MESPRVLDVGDRRQLFIDDRFFLRQYGMRLTVNPPAKAQMVLRPEMPWERGALGLYATVLEDEGVYKLWYDGFVGVEAYPEVPRSLCYATSTDGLHWTREKVNLFDWKGHRENNIVVPSSDVSVMLDPRAPAEQRFKGVAAVFDNPLWPESHGCHWDMTGGSIHVLTSPDGIRWRRVRPVASPFFHNSLNPLVYDDRTGKYFAYVRTHERGRTLALVVLDDPTKTPWPFRPPPAHIQPNEHGLYLGVNFGSFDVTMSCDESDPPDTDLQLCTVVKYPWAQDAYIGLFVPYRHYPETVPGKFRNDGPQDVQLAISRDGIHWSRPDRRPYIRLGLAGEWDGGCLWPTQGLIRRGDEIWQYYSATKHTHGDWDARTPTQGGIRRLVQRLDGFVSADADYTGGEFFTPLLRFRGSELVLNADCSAMGTIQVEILDEHQRPLEGFTLKDAIPVDRNHLAARVRWQGDPSLAARQDRPVSLHVKLRACKLYAFAFRP